MRMTVRDGAIAQYTSDLKMSCQSLRIILYFFNGYVMISSILLVFSMSGTQNTVMITSLANNLFLGILLRGMLDEYL